MSRNQFHMPISRLERASPPLLMIALFAACATAYMPSNDVHTRIQAIGNAVGAVRAEKPNLIGLQDYDVMNRNAFSGRTEDDINLIVGRVYLDAASRLRQSTRTASYADNAQLRAAVGRALSEHRPISKYSRAYFDNLLSDTKRRIASDEKYYCSVATSAQAARYAWDPAWDNYRCIVDGFETSISVCRALVLGDMVETLTVS